jgi:hypothetical protein
MGLLDEVAGILKQYQSAGTTPSSPQDVATHFEQVANTVPSSTLADGIAHAIRSNSTPAFGQIVSDLFSQSNGSQRAGILNHLLAATGGAATTPEQAQQMLPQVVQQLADKAHQADPSVINALSGFFAQHPTLTGGLGTNALALIMSRVSQTHPTN